MDKEDRIQKRYYILSSLEKIIEDSIYYRNNNKYMDESRKYVIANIKSEESKKKII